MLDALIGINAREFNDHIRGKSTQVWKRSSLEYEPLLSWDRLNRHLNYSERFLDGVEISKEGARLDRRLFVEPARPGRRARLAPGAVRKALSEGYSVLINEVGSFDPGVRSLEDLLTKSLGERVSINAYVSWMSEKCFDTHWDDHDVFIMQTEGEKEWTVFRPTREHPLKLDVAYETDTSQLEVAWAGTLAKGDILYIPRGWWHHAVSTGAGSIHLTAGFTSRTVLDFLTFLVDRAAKDSRFRADLERDYVDKRDDVKTHLMSMIHAHLDEIRPTDVVHEFWQNHFARLPHPSPSHLPLSLQSDAFFKSQHGVRLNSIAPVVTVTTSDDAVSMETAGRRWAFAPQTAPLLEELAAGAVLPVQPEAVFGLSTEDYKAFLFELLNEGLVSLAEPQPKQAPASAPLRSTVAIAR